jgi:HK97 family phage prohead protease/HK97 family phage major capsid protein
VSEAQRRAYSTVIFKSVDDEQGIIEGTASTIETDRMGDVVVPEGAKFTLPLPLLWQHRSDQPIGQVISAKVTKAGITMRAKIARNLGIPRIDEAWALIKAGLVRGLSIGFQPIDDPEPIKGTFGLRFPTWTWLELSAVTIPANADANILTVKSADAPHLALSGTRSRAASHPPAVAGLQRKGLAMNYSERLTTAQAELTQKTADLEALMAIEELNEEQTSERDSLTSEIDRLTATVKSLATLERVQSTKAETVSSRQITGTTSTAKTFTVEEPKLPPGIAFARFALCHLAAQNMTMKGHPTSPIQLAKQWYPSSERTLMVVKAAVAPANTTDANWASPLVYNETIADFVEYLRPRTVVGQFGQGNIPALNRVPFNMRQVTESSAMTGYWVGQGAPKPLTKAGYTASTLGFAKVAAITVDTEELLRFANTPGISAETAMRDGLTRALVAKIDSTFIDPSVAAVSNVSPASITNGLSLGSSAGNTADDVRADILTLFSSFLGADMDPRGIVLIMPPAVALSLSLLRTTVGAQEFPNITINGGSLQGIPVIVSNYAALAGYGNLVIAVVAPEINLADDGQVTVDMSREASLEMSDAPTQSGTTGVSLVSLWQNNLVAFRAERFINWGLRRSGVVAAIQSVNWGGVGSPS